MELKHNVVGWFEIPVKDMERAVNFYETVFNMKLQRVPLGDSDQAWFPVVENGMGCPGSLVLNDDYIPSSDGVLIYFTSPSGDITEDLRLAGKTGGSILMEKTLITKEIGYMGVFIDSEGNRIALHSRQ